jgi:DnaJ like chaperone protein
MSIWSWIGGSADGGSVFGAFFEWVGGLLPTIGDPATRRQVAFSVALIALSAKMAKADGIVTRDEVAAFERMFKVPAGEEKHVNRLFDLARQDVAGFETYAGRIASLYEGDRAALEDVVDGLFAIAGADGAVHEAELIYLERVSEIFSIDRAAFERISARHIIPEEGDPYLILGVDRSLGFVEIKARYRLLAAENHPDRLLARGIPPEAASIAHERMAVINRAFERIERERRR